MPNSIAGRVALVTGGSKGIGRGIVEVLASHGARVALTSRQAATAAQVATEIGAGCIGLGADVTRSADLVTACAQTARHFGALDILVVNAGIFPMAPIEVMTSADWDETLDTNLKSTFLAVQAALPHLKQSDQARIILTSSITGPVTGYPGWAHYAASKAGQLGFMRSAALELVRHGITVNAVLPGNILTEGFAADGPDYLAEMTAAIPMRRLGHPQDIGHAVAYFASRGAGFVTGQTLIVDGGQVLPEGRGALA